MRQFVGLAILLLLILGVFLFTSKPIDEGFTVQLNACPATTHLIQSAKGFTDCCTGELLNGKCSSKTICTQSPTHDKIPTCSEYWTKHFERKSKELCPSWMPHYYEDIKGSKGCSAYPPKPDGSAPTQLDSKCTVYTNHTDNESKADSCFLQKQMTSLKCPMMEGIQGRLVLKSNGPTFSYYTCNYSSPTTLQRTCAEDSSYKKYLDHTNPNWSRSSTVQTLQGNFCSNYIENQKNAIANKQALERALAAQQAAEKQKQDALSAMDHWKQMFLKLQRK